MSILISIIGAILGIIFTNVIFSNFIEKSTSVIIKIVAMIVAAVVFGFIFYALAPKFISVELKLIESIEDSLKKFSLVDIVIGTIGLVVGLILAFLISQPLLKLNIPGIGTVLTVIFEIVFYIGMGFLGAKLALNYHDDFLAFFERIKTKEKPNLKFSNKDSKVR
ncbi:MAG: PIN/TRAM domain-containing protein, partial [Finegoldia magna]|nr:PIN/TRAM domain-containing protein [Finegoldia magna]